MATKKDLIEAQGFSRRRLLTAFTSGAPGGKELEPAAPLRAVVAGVALSAMVILAGVFYGIVRPGLPDGWENNTLILVKDSGARMLSVDGTLYPVLNSTSARLLMPAGEFTVVTTDASTVAGIPVGPTIGILGAPDDVPSPSALIPAGWAACVTDQGTGVLLAADSPATETTDGTVVENEGTQYVIAGEMRYAVADDEAASVLRAVELAGTTPDSVDSRWLNLFEEGTELAPLVVPGAGDPVPGTDLVVGAVVHPTGEDRRYLVTPEGELAVLSPLAYNLYMLGTGSELGGEREVTAGELAQLPNSTEVAGPADWPTEPLTPLPGDIAPCALLGHDESGTPHTVLATPDGVAGGDGVSVDLRAGALVAAGGSGSSSTSTIVLIDESGTAFAIPEADEDVLGRLGYAPADVSRITSAWLQFFPSGPALTVEAAGSSPTGGAEVAPAPAPSPSETPSADAVLAAQGCEPGTVVYSTATPAALALLQADTAWQRATGAGVVVAVIDSGIDAQNAHLSGVVIGGIDLVGDGENPQGMSDPNGHGTAIAGLIAAQRHPESGVVGLASDARLLSVRVFRGDDDESARKGWGTDNGRLATGITWAVDHGADILNVSMSDTVDDPRVRAAVADAEARGALVVASGGNRKTTEQTEDSPRYPGALPEALAVSASDAYGRVTDSSIHGAHIDLAAPGGDILTTTTGGGDCLYATDSPSSSFATGYASAAAALVAQAHPQETPAEWRYRLTATATRGNPDARDDLAGWGVVQPADAITLVPGAGVRGPENPFTGLTPDAVMPDGVVLTPDHSASPFVVTREAAILIGIIGGTVLGALGVLAIMRRKRSAIVGEPSPARAGLLDKLKDDATRTLD